MNKFYSKNTLEVSARIHKVLMLSFTIFVLSSCGKQNTCYINPSKLLQGYHGAQAQHELFQAKARDWQLRIDSLGTELQALRTAPPATRAAKEQQLGQYRQAIQQRAQQENQRLTQAVLAKIRSTLS